jgi:hypothetical protein
MKENGRGGECGTNGRERICIKILVGKAEWKRCYLLVTDMSNGRRWESIRSNTMINDGTRWESI